ncbi:hypothetical protein BDY24DRAFT_378046 [Mrakia frigida]|uniref:uncharacterized protein n=1 Tax=Mrakia frigida TaxID=29902 RepID=UPI003FCC1896
MARPSSSSSNQRIYKPNFDQPLSQAPRETERPRPIEIRGRAKAIDSRYGSLASSLPESNSRLPQSSKEPLIAPAFYEPDFDRPTRPTSPSPSAPSLLSRITSPPRGPRSQLVQERSPPQTFIPPSRPIPTGPRTSSQEYSPQVSTIATSPSTTYRRRSPPPQGRSLAPSFPPPLASSAALFPPHPQTPELGSIVGAQQYPDPQLDPPRAEPGSLREVMQQIRLDNARRRPGALEVGTNGGRIADGHDPKNKEQQVGSASRERDAGSSSLSDAVASKQEEAARRSGPVDRPQRPSTSTSTQQPTRSRPSALSFFNENERIKIEPDEQPLTRPESSTPSASSQPPRAVAQQPNPLSTSHHPQQPSLAISSRPVTASLASASRPSRRCPSPSTSTVPRPAKGTSRGRSPEFFDRRAMRDEPRDLEGRGRTVEGRRRVEEEDEMRRLTGRGRAEEGRHGEPKDGGERSGGKAHWVRKKSLGDVRRESDEREAARWKASRDTRIDSPPPHRRRALSPPPRQRPVSPPRLRRDPSPPSRQRNFSPPPPRHRPHSPPPRRDQRSLSPRRPILARPRSRSPPRRRLEDRSRSPNKSHRIERVPSPPPLPRAPARKDHKLLPSTDYKLLIVDLDESVGREQIELMLENISLVRPIEVRLSSSESAVFFDTQDDAEQAFATANEIVIDTRRLRLAWPDGKKPSSPQGPVLRVYTKISVSAAGLYLSLIRYGLISSAFPIWPEGSRAFSFIVQFQDASSSRKFVRDVDSKKFDLRALSDLCVLGIQGESDYRRFLEMLREGSVVGCSKGPTNRSAVFFQVGSLSRASHLVDKYKSYLPFGAGSKILVRYGELGRESQFGVDVLDLDVLPLRPQQPWQDYKDELPRAAKRGQSGRPRVPEPNPPTPLSQQLQDPAPAHPRRIRISSPPRGGQRDTTRRARDIELPSIPSGPSSTRRRTRSASPPSRWTSSQPQKDLVDDAQTQRASSSTKASVEDVSTAGVEKERRVAVEQKVAGRPSRQSYTCVGVGDLDDSDDEGDEVAAVEVPVDFSFLASSASKSAPQPTPGGSSAVALDGSNAVAPVLSITPEQQAIIQQTIQLIQQQQLPPPVHFSPQQHPIHPSPQHQLQPRPLPFPVPQPQPPQLQAAALPTPAPFPPSQPPQPTPMETGYSNEQLLALLSVQFPVGTPAREELRRRDPGVTFMLERREAELAVTESSRFGSVRW